MCARRFQALICGISDLSAMPVHAIFVRVYRNSYIKIISEQKYEKIKSTINVFYTKKNS